MGLKRNIACQLSRGDIIAHFDDDDLYGPGYLTYMVGQLLKVLQDEKVHGANRAVHDRLRPAAITLAQWHLLDLSDLTFGFMDVRTDPLVPVSQRRGWLYGWGFSYVYSRSAWETALIPDVEWSEDISFYEDLLRLKVPVFPVPLPNRFTGICVHSHFPKVNTSGGEFAGPLRCGEPVSKPPSGLQDLIPIVRELAERISTREQRPNDIAGVDPEICIGLSEKQEFMQGRGQAWLRYQRHVQEKENSEVRKKPSVIPFRVWTGS